MVKKIKKESPEKLKKLYWENEMSSVEIAELYNCSASNIRYWMEKYGIERRSKAAAREIAIGIDISKEQLKDLYLKQKLSSPKIAKKFKCSASYIRKKLREFNIPIRSYSESHLLCNQPKYERRDFSGNLQEKAYLIGFRVGDLYVERTSSRSLLVSTNSTRKEQISLFKKIFSRYGHITTGKPDKNGAVSVRTYLNNSFSFLLEGKQSIDEWIVNNNEVFAEYLAGYIDAEGTFCICGGSGVFSIKSQDEEIIRKIYSKLINLEILLRPPQVSREEGAVDKRGVASNKDVYYIAVHRKKSLLKLIDLIGSLLKHAKRKKDMRIVRNNILKRNKKYNRVEVGSKWDKLYNQKT